ncbi:MAG: hypothetical protein KZQ61_09675, partial [Candidatus Thiodiazotropha sp. (ex Lucinoma aequizonata)]|nr:hypothetical protein [Candidatus Thiodiazotropha sp. (ex Lucinoma aequizonata)]
MNEVMLVTERTEQTRKRHSITVQATARLTEEINTIGRLPDCDAHQEAYDQAVENIADWSEAQLNDPSSFNIWQREFSKHVIRGRLKIKMQSMQVLKQATDAQNERDLQTLALIASQTSDHTEKMMAVEQGKRLLQSQLEGCMYDAYRTPKTIKRLFRGSSGCGCARHDSSRSRQCCQT